MSDSSPPEETPPGQPAPPPNPYGSAPQYGQPVPPPNPYGSAPQYGQPAPPPNPYGSVPQYGTPAQGQQVAPAYGQQGTYPQSAYGQSTDPDKRPGTVTAAGVITLIMSGLTLLLFGFVAIGLLIARDDVVNEIRSEPGFVNINANDLVSVLIVLVLVFAIWCLAAIVLAVFAMRRSNVARILLVISAGMTALLSLLGITAIVTLVPLGAAIAVIVLLFVGDAGTWYARKATQPGG